MKNIMEKNIMKNWEYKMKRNVAIMIILSLALFTISCDSESNPSIWAKNDAGEPTPTINSVNPPSQEYGGVGTRKLITITGTNFSSDIDKNFVYFGTENGDIIDASTTELKVAAPANYGTGLKVQVHTEGAYFSAFYGSEDTPTPYELISAETKIGFYDKYRIPQGLCADAEGNVFITVGENVDKVSLDGSIKQNILTLKGKGTSNIKVGPGGALYYTYLKYILKTDTISGAHTYKSIGFTTMDLDFDANNNLWIIGPEKIAVANYTDLATTDAYENEDLNFSVCRFYNDDLYVVTKYVGSDTTVSKSPYLGKIAINSDGTVSGDVELIRYLDADGYDDIAVTGITFNSEGDLYIATKNYSLLYVDGDIAIAPYHPVYPAILSDYPAFRFAWGIGDETYINTFDADDNTKASIKRIMLFDESAPVYGR
jgi:hypothetical protein